MAVYKIFPVADTTIYSEYNQMNTGMDAILELSKTPTLRHSTNFSSAARSLIKFSTEDIEDVVNVLSQNKPIKTELNIHLADAIEIPTTLTIEAAALAEDFDMGVGRFGNVPENTTGASWKYRKSNSTQPWATGSYITGTTGSFTSDNPGGGTWYTASIAQQSFGVYQSKDLVLNVTPLVNMMLSGSIPNHGFVVKNTGSIEFDKNYNYTLTYFSNDTNTIYPPTLDIKWDDSEYSVADTQKICTNTNILVTLQKPNITLNESSVIRFRLNVRDKYPTRTFSTTSIYTTQKYLPQESYYSIVDHKTGEPVVDFDEGYTKISADNQGNYFDLYMNGFQPFRYYSVKIKTVINTETIVFEDAYIFKTN